MLIVAGVGPEFRWGRSTCSFYQNRGSLSESRWTMRYGEASGQKVVEGRVPVRHGGSAPTGANPPAIPIAPLQGETSRPEISSKFSVSTLNRVCTADRLWSHSFPPRTRIGSVVDSCPARSLAGFVFKGRGVRRVSA
jgi:hypothetical protein